MSDSQKRFFALLGHYPRLEEFWDEDEQSLDDDKLFAELGVLSSGEQVVARALASIWLGNAGKGRWLLDVTDVAALSDECRKPIVEWLANPFWP